MEAIPKALCINSGSTRLPTAIHISQKGQTASQKGGLSLKAQKLQNLMGNHICQLMQLKSGGLGMRIIFKIKLTGGTDKDTCKLILILLCFFLLLNILVCYFLKGQETATELIRLFSFSFFQISIGKCSYVRIFNKI